MAEQGLLAKLGLRIGTIGSAASLAIALGNGGPATDMTVHTASNRTGWYGDLTAGAEKLSHVIGGVQGPTFQVVGGVMRTVMPGNARVETGNGNLIMTGVYTGLGSTQAGYLMDGAGSIVSGSFTELSGTVLSYGINVVQVTRTDNSRAGGIFRLDCRTGSAIGDAHCFVVKAQTGPGTETNRIIIDLDTGHSYLNPAAGSTLIGTMSLLGSEKLRVVGDAQINGLLTVNQITSPRTGGAGNYNEGFGLNTLMTINGGWSNTAVGNGTAYNITTGYENVAMGAAALGANTTGYENTAIGVHAYETNQGGAGSTVVGFRAAKLATVGSITAIGFYALQALTTGTPNVAVGSNAQYSNSTGTGNVAVGTNALYTNTAGSGQVAIGDGALFTYDSSGNGSNTAVGSSALYYTTTGFGCTAVGFLAAQANTTAYNTTAIGSQALWSNQTGLSNTAVGTIALSQVTDGSANTAVGSDSGRNGSTPLLHITNCSFFGAGANASADSITNSTAIGYQSQVTASNQMALGNGVTNYIFRGVNYTFPAAAAAGVLLSDGSGNLSWSAVGTIGGSVAATQVAYGSGANTITSSATLVYDPTTGLHMVLGAITDVTPLLVSASYNSYIQENLQNLSNGTGASGDYVVTADTGTETTNYVDFGINGSGYTGGYMGAALEGYLYASDQNLNIGAVASGKSVVIVAGGTSATTNKVASFSSTTLNHFGSGGVVSIVAATNDAIKMVGRGGGTGSWTGTMIPGTLSANRTWTFPNADGTITTGTGTSGRIAYWSGTNAVSSSANLTWTTTSGATLLVDTGGTSTATSAVTYGFTQTITYTGTSTTDKGSAIFTTTATPGAAVSSTYNGISANVTSTLANVQYESGATLNAIVANSSFTSAYTTNATVLGTMNGILISPAISNTGATASITHTYTSIAGIRVVPGTWNITTATCGITVTDYYGAYLGTVTFSGSGAANGVITNRWGLYQADAAATAYVAGKILVGGLTAPGTELLRFNNSGGTGLSAFDSAAHLGIGLTAPTALLHLAAGVASANGAPFKFTSGTNLTNPEAGAVEFDGTYLYYTNSTPTRQTIATRNFLSLTDASPIVVGAITAHQTTATVTLTASGHTVSNPTSSLVDGAMLFFRIIQGGTGSYTVTWGTKYQFSSTMPAPTLSTAVGAIDYVGFIYCTASDKWHCISYALSYT